MRRCDNRGRSDPAIASPEHDARRRTPKVELIPANPARHRREDTAKANEKRAQARPELGTEALANCR